MISGEAFKKFFQSEKTLNIASSNMIHTRFPELFRNMSHITVLNNWIFEDYRNIYEGEYQNRIFINITYALNVPEI